jgi:MFS family permease
MSMFSFEFGAIRRVLRHPNFAMYTVGSTISLIGLWVQRLAVGWLVWDLTKSGVWLGAVALAEFLPTIVITPLGGVISDRFDRRRISMTTQTLAAIQAGVLWALTVAGVVTPEAVVVLVFAGGVFAAINQASRVALVPMMVPREQMTTAIALTAVIFNLARFVGPAVAGVIIATLGIGWAFFVNAVSYVPLIHALGRLTLNPTPRRGPSKHFFADLMDGVRYTVRHESISTLIILLALASVLTRAVVELLPGFVDQVYARGPAGLAVFTSVMGIGAMVAGLLLAGRRHVTGLSGLVFVTVLLNGLAVALFGALSEANGPSFWLAAFLLGISGFCNVASGTGSQTLVQTAVDESMRGRVLSLWLVVNRGGPALGAMIFGWASEAFGFGWPTVIGGAATVIAAARVLGRRRILADELETPSGETPLRATAPNSAP